jgi:hypothetical protein
MDKSKEILITSKGKFEINRRMYDMRHVSFDPTKTTSGATLLHPKQINI